MTVINQLTPEQRAELMFDRLGSLTNETANQFPQSFLLSLNGMTVNVSAGSSTASVKVISLFKIVSCLCDVKQTFLSGVISSDKSYNFLIFVQNLTDFLVLLKPMGRFITSSITKIVCVFCRFKCFFLLQWKIIRNHNMFVFMKNDIAFVYLFPR